MRPFSSDPPQGVDLSCENGHSQRIYLQGYTVEMARDYAAILDGSHPIYKKPPRDDPNTFIGHCKDCGALFSATLFGYDESSVDSGD